MNDKREHGEQERVPATRRRKELVTVDTPAASARGAALLGGIATGIWPDAATTEAVALSSHVVAVPSTKQAAYEEVYARYLRLSGATSVTA